MNKFSIVLTLLLCGSCALALDPNLEKLRVQQVLICLPPNGIYLRH
ncbi:hypothetical protein OLS36_04715 [Campylobacter jejuni]|nr:hypothetical protein [Campylobacter jejuni]